MHWMESFSRGGNAEGHGRILDPLADKALVLPTLIGLALIGSRPSASRRSSSSGAVRRRGPLCDVRQGLRTHASGAAETKTACEMAAVVLLIAPRQPSQAPSARCFDGRGAHRHPDLACGPTHVQRAAHLTSRRMPAKRAPTFDELVDRMAALHGKLRRRKLTVAAAESCTGGLLGAVLTAHGGSSEYFRGGAVVYSNEAKEVLADVTPQLIHSHGAVSSVVAGALARGSRTRLDAKIGLGITASRDPVVQHPQARRPHVRRVDSDKHSAVKKHSGPSTVPAIPCARRRRVDLLEDAIE